MHVVELSNHPEERRRRLQRKTQEEREATQARFAEALVEYNTHLDALRSERSKALADRRLLTWLAVGFTMRRARRAAPQEPTFATPVTDEEEILSAGVEGEQMAISKLGAALDSNWYLYRGYRNRRGEIDQLLVGPTGLYAIEVKHLNATVSCEGDYWWSKHFDKYGNLKREGAIVDRGGRSPSEQLNMPADALEEFLRSRSHVVSIWRVVLLTHYRSQVVYCGDQTVDLITDSTDDVLAFLRSSPPTPFLVWSRPRSETPLGAMELREIEQLIERDHRHHNSRQRHRRS